MSATSAPQFRSSFGTCQIEIAFLTQCYIGFLAVEAQFVTGIA